MQPPADPCRQLLRLRARQQVAEIQGMKILLFIHPLVLLDDFAVHKSDLPGRAAETQTADAREDADKFAKIRGVHSIVHCQ